jgi:hypothetical protein
VLDSSRSSPIPVSDPFEAEDNMDEREGEEHEGVDAALGLDIETFFTEFVLLNSNFVIIGSQISLIQSKIVSLTILETLESDNNRTMDKRPVSFDVRAMIPPHDFMSETKANFAA